MWFSIPLGPGKMTKKEPKDSHPLCTTWKIQPQKIGTWKIAPLRLRFLWNRSFKMFLSLGGGMCLLPSIWLTQSNGVLSFFHDLSVCSVISGHTYCVNSSLAYSQTKEGRGSYGKFSWCLQVQRATSADVSTTTHGTYQGCWVDSLSLHICSTLLASLQFRMPSFHPPDWLSTPAGLQAMDGIKSYFRNSEVNTVNLVNLCKNVSFMVPEREGIVSQFVVLFCGGLGNTRFFFLIRSQMVDRWKADIISRGSWDQTFQSRDMRILQESKYSIPSEQVVSTHQVSKILTTLDIRIISHPCDAWNPVSVHLLSCHSTQTVFLTCRADTVVYVWPQEAFMTPGFLGTQWHDFSGFFNRIPQAAGALYPALPQKNADHAMVAC